MVKRINNIGNWHIFDTLRGITSKSNNSSFGTDAVLFADPKKSTIDIVQAAGRAMRRSKGKEYGYIIVPIIVDEDEEGLYEKTGDEYFGMKKKGRLGKIDDSTKFIVKGVSRLSVKLVMVLSFFVLSSFSGSSPNWSP